ncbi:hypothetical protein WJX84_011185 [Apatococcus fuscideae]|uniref:isoamylase n=1 Tax=Apatococcus fuscideae TaxID=2026836 RepID=A0AAW1THG1_9CHLO
MLSQGPDRPSGTTDVRASARASPAPSPDRAVRRLSASRPKHIKPEQNGKQIGTQAARLLEKGAPHPLGPTAVQGGINFAVFSSGAEHLSVCFFNEADLKQGRVTHEVQLDPIHNKTGDVWHILMPQLDTSLLYGFRVTGPHQSSHESVPGHRYHQDQVMLDPYAKGVVSRRIWGQHAPELEWGEVLGLAATWPQAAGVLPSQEPAFDWQGTKPLRLPREDLIIYEMHVRGFTQSPTSASQHPGTFAGLVEKLDYLEKLGINAVELLPSQEFNELEYYSAIPGTDNFRYNYWGYSTGAFFAPMTRYSQAAADGKSGQHIINEFKLLVRECHKRGIEVIMDVVFNHTSEGNEKGPVLSMRGLDNRIYYMLAPEGEYYNYTGCGNTLNCNHPIVRRFILDCLHYWVEEMHVDGFRFDLASIMTRAHSEWKQPAAMPEGAEEDAGEEAVMVEGAGVPVGTPLADPALIEMISEDPILRDTLLIAEAWDAAGLYQAGAFPHYCNRWSEWNGNFRDTVRAFIKGSDGTWSSQFASAMSGSPSLYCDTEPKEEDWWGNNGGRGWKGNRSPLASINFITAHDGFTLADLTTFNEKHNAANGEQNRDGESHNLTWNCGVEGPSREGAILRLRARQMRNLATALLVAQGIPMILMGDEYGHSKGGNNNTYCHDSHLNWLDWQRAEAPSNGYARFFRHLIRFRLSRPELKRASFGNTHHMAWHGSVPDEPDWTETSRLVAWTVSTAGSDPNDFGGLYIAFSTFHKPITLELPVWPGRLWQPVIDTGKPAPYDFLIADEVLSEASLSSAMAAGNMWTADSLYPLLPWSAAVLISVPEKRSQ